jgi:hypothetical protein
VLVSWIDDDGEHRSMHVPAAYADAAGRVLQDDLGLAHVRVGGRRPGGPAEEHHRHVFAAYQAGQHRGAASDQAAPDGR